MTASQISNHERNEVLQTTTEWLKLLAEKESKHPKNPLLSTSKSMCTSIQTHMQIAIALNTNPEEKPLFVCRDVEGRIQAIAITEKRAEGLFLSYLATHPNNLNLEINQGLPNRVRGAGSLLLAHCAQECAKVNGTLRLVAVAGSHRFYSGLGMETVSPYNPSDFFLTTARCKNLADRFFQSTAP